MNQKAPSPKAIPLAGLDIQLRDYSHEGSISLSVNGVPVSIGSGESAPGRVNDGQLSDSPVSGPTPMTPVTPPAQRTLNGRWDDFRCHTGDYRLFLRFALQAPSALALVGLLQFILYQQFFAQEPGFLARYGWWLFYMNISVVALAAVLGYLRAYSLGTSHMLGMMISMVVGMQVGTMLGAPLGATNGLFVGSLVGMFTGGLSGFYIGSRCGSTMAIIQGLMSGGMSGTMGAMLIAMMVRDHVLIFMPFFTLANLLILLGFTYLFYEEGVEGGPCRIRRSPGFFSLAVISILVTTLMALLMLYGPKGPMVWTGQAPSTIGMSGMGSGMMNMLAMK